MINALTTYAQMPAGSTSNSPWLIAITIVLWVMIIALIINRKKLKK